MHAATYSCSVGDNNIGADGAKALAEMLNKNPTITLLDLGQLHFVIIMISIQ